MAMKRLPEMVLSGCQDDVTRWLVSSCVVLLYVVCTPLQLHLPCTLYPAAIPSSTPPLSIIPVAIMNTDSPTDNHVFVSKIFRRLPPTSRGHVVATIGEFFGTFFFLFFAFSGAQTANVSSNPNTGNTVITETIQATPAQLLYTALAFGFSLAANAWVYFRISGGLFNPAVRI